MYIDIDIMDIDTDIDFDVGCIDMDKGCNITYNIGYIVDIAYNISYHIDLN